MVPSITNTLIGLNYYLDRVRSCENSNMKDKFFVIMDVNFDFY